MKFLVMSDNHGLKSQVEEILAVFAPQVDYVFHCGDSEFPWSDSVWEPVDLRVTGNMDFDPKYPLVDTLDTPVGRVLVTHGHRFGVNLGLDQLIALGRSQEARFVFYGHTHRLGAQEEEGMIFLNPGSINHSRGTIPESTFALVSVEADKVDVDYYNANSFRLMPELTQTFNL